MTIQTIQTCDGCGTKRELLLIPNEGTTDLIRESGKDGWATVLSNKHLCTKCLKATINR